MGGYERIATGCYAWIGVDGVARHLWVPADVSRTKIEVGRHITHCPVDHAVYSIFMECKVKIRAVSISHNPSLSAQLHSTDHFFLIVYLPIFSPLVFPPFSIDTFIRCQSTQIIVANPGNFTSMETPNDSFFCYIRCNIKSNVSKLK